MKLVLFEHEGRTEPGVLAGDGVVSVAHLAESIPAIIDDYERLRDGLLACTERPPIPWSRSRCAPRSPGLARSSAASPTTGSTPSASRGR